MRQALIDSAARRKAMDRKIARGEDLTEPQGQRTKFAACTTVVGAAEVWPLERSVATHRRRCW